MSEDWDVESYRTEFESDDHWELRKNFMLAHKDRFSEDEIVCLAQVFTNIEFLGCRYPDETMRKVSELAKGVVESYREKKKNCLKRTFVAASEAAASKVKGIRGDKGDKLNIQNVKKRRIDGENIKKDQQDNINRVKSNEKCNYFGQCTDSNNAPCKKGNGVSTVVKSSKNHRNLNIRKLEGPFADFVFFLDDEKYPANLLERNASLNKCLISWKYGKGQTDPIFCAVYINDELLGTAEGKSKKLSRELASRIAIEKLQTICYTVKIKVRFLYDKAISPAQLSSSGMEKVGTKCKVGEQIMRLMGWTGGGLGPNADGIIDPISLLSTKGRRGIGSCNDNDHEFKNRAGSLIRKWMQSDTERDLVFTSEFSSDQRKTLHMLAKKYSLKSKSYGKEGARHLVLSRKPPSPWTIVEELMKVGGSTDKYELIEPNM